MRSFAFPVAGLLALGLLAGCSGQDDGPEADSLTEALTSGDFGAVSFDGSTPAAVGKDYERITEGLGKLSPEVTPGEPTIDGASAEVPLTWRWSVPGQDWTYETEAQYRKAGEEWRVVWAPEVVHEELRGPQDRLTAQRLLAKRGEIRGARGARLVRERPVESYGIDKARVESTAAAVRSARLLARMVDVDEQAYVKAVRAAGPQAFVEAITYRKGEAPAAARRASNVLGVLVLPSTRALAPTKEFAAPILGTVGPVTAEIIKDNPGVYENGDEAGLSGLQARYDEQLRGVPGTTIDVIHGRDGSGGSDELFSVPARNGEILTTTLDQRLQTAAERALADTGPASALVALRPSDGAILAAANGPGTNGVNIATYGQAAPGSTFKTATTLALLRHGVSPRETVECSPTITVDGKRFRNDSWYPAAALGRVPLATAVAQSCNTAMISRAGDVSHQELADAAASLGFGIDHEVGFPAYFGQIPDAGSETAHAAEMIGQGQVLASPMVMATMIGSIQAGETVVPTLVTGVDGLDTAVPDAAQPLTKSETAQLRTIFRGVVTGGTGSGLADVPGGPVIAKTGTAEFDRDGERLTHTWMIAAQGDLAVAVYVDEGENGAATSGPLLESFLRAAH